MAVLFVVVVVVVFCCCCCCNFMCVRVCVTMIRECQTNGVGCACVCACVRDCFYWQFVGWLIGVGRGGVDMLAYFPVAIQDFRKHIFGCAIGDLQH